MPSETPDMLGYRLLQRTLVVCVIVLITAQLLVLLLALDKSRSRCEDVQAIRSYILAATERSMTATPTLAYYKAHPAELRDVMENLRRQRDAFSDPLRCSLI